MNDDVTETSAPSTAVIAYGSDDLRVEDRAVRTPAANEAVVRVAFGGICGSDLHYWTHGAAGDSVMRAPLVLGHEVVGTVEVAAADGSGPAAGTRVAVHPASPAAGEQRYPTDRPNLSPGCTYLGSAAHFPHTDGAFSSRAVLPSRMLRPLPDSLSLREAALAEPASVAWHAVSRAGEVAGKRVLVIGCGPIGLLVVAAAKRAGAASIVATDVHAKPLEIARRVGATEVYRSSELDSVAAVDADAVIESSGSPHGLASGIRAATRGGRVVMVGLIPSGDAAVPISVAITRELELVGSFRFNDEIDEVLEALADRSLQVDGIVTHEFDVENALEAFATANDPSVSAKVLLSFTGQ